MKRKIIGPLCLGFLLVVSSAGLTRAIAADGKNLPLVFDPQTKKYFIGGNSKFVLKQNESSSLVEKIEVSVDNSEYKQYGEAIEFKEEGKHTLKFRAVNAVNHWSPVQFVEVFADLTPATTEAKFQDEKNFKNESGFYVSLGSTITLMSQDNLSGVASLEYSWDGSSFNSYAKPIVVEKPGSQSLYFRSTDRVGNAEPVKQIDFIADGNSPSSELKLNRQTATGSTVSPTVINGKNYLSDSVAFSIQSQDDYSQVKQTWVEIDGKQQVYIRPIYFLQEGPHTISYYSVDNTGNRETSKSLSIYTVSSTPRTLTKTNNHVVNMGGINYAKSGFQLQIDAHANIVGVEKVEYKTETDTEYRAYIEPIRFPSPGLHSVSYRSVDRVGNVEPAKAYNVFITDNPPETTLSSAQPFVMKDGVAYSPAPNVLTLNVGSTPVGIKQTFVSMNDGQFQPYNGPITLAANQKVHKISYKSVDRLNNEEHPKTMTLHMIGASPVVDLFVSSGQSAEEAVRTNYLEQPGKAPAEQESTRGLASTPQTETTEKKPVKK